MRIRLGHFLFVLFFLCGGAQAQESLAYMLRLDGYAVEADALSRVVSLELSPEWSKAFQGAKNKEERKVLAHVIGAFLDSRIETDEGKPIRYLPTGLMLAAMDDAKGRASLYLGLKFAPNAITRKQTLESMERLALTLEETEQSSKKKLAFSFDPEARGIEQSAFKEQGSDVFLILPANPNWNREFVQLQIH